MNEVKNFVIEKIRITFSTNIPVINADYVEHVIDPPQVVNEENAYDATIDWFSSKLNKPRSYFLSDSSRYGVISASLQHDKNSRYRFTARFIGGGPLPKDAPVWLNVAAASLAVYANAKYIEVFGHDQNEEDDA